MFSVLCQCGRPVNVATTQLNQPIKCPSCKRAIVCVSAEPLDDHAAAADFDAALLVIDGPDRAGQLLRLGGSATIDVGTDPANTLVLRGENIAAGHCKIVRIAFEPSVWRIEDTSSAGGIFVNDEQVTSHELADGDTLQIGDYEFACKMMPSAHAVGRDNHSLQDAASLEAETSIRRAEAAPLVAPPSHADDWPVCPSCKRDLDPGATICIDCGIRIRSGRPLLMSEGLDENTVYGNAETALRGISWLVPFTPLPIPIASAAYGKHKPYAIWIIAGITLFMSGWIFVASSGGDSQHVKQLALWPLHPDVSKVEDWEIKQVPHRQISADGVPRELSYDERREQVILDHRRNSDHFHWWQLFTHAAIHDPSSLAGFILHLGGNILFLIVFGSRVNAIIGNLATAILYPLLAAASGLVFVLKVPGGTVTPLMGASGAVNAMAGMYLVLLPAHYVYCAAWFRFIRNLTFKIFALRGFWVLLIYFAYDLAMMFFGSEGTVAHWASISGFVIGVIVGIALLVSRAFNCRNGDLLSLVLGKYAWWLIGKPSQWEEKIVVAPAE